MSGDRLMHASTRWFRALLRLYPVDFRDEMGDAVVEAYRDRARQALSRGGIIRLAAVWMAALAESLRSGLGERARPAASWRRSGNWGRDLELATRRLIRAPLFVAAMVGTLTVGLGAFAVVYTVVQKILIEPMPYSDPDDLYFVWRDYGPIFDLKRGWLGGTDVAELQKAGGVIEDAAGLGRGLRTFSMREGTDPTEIAVMVTSPNLFELLGVRPALGRGFARSEVGPGRPPLIVLTDELWHRVGADPAIVGTDVRLNGEPYTVIGVMPPRFAFARNESLGPPQSADAYITFDMNLAETNPGNGSYAGLIRARRGTTPQRVAAAIGAIGRAVDARDFESRGLKLYSVGLKPDLVSRVRPALLLLGFAGMFLLLVLAVNLASVLLARAAQREHEFAVSRALGANGVAVARAMLFEGGLLGLVGGVAGALAAIGGTRTLVALAPLDLPRRDAVAVDWGIGAVVIGIGVLLGLLAATVPATWAGRASLSSLLSASAVRGGGGHGRMRRGMVVAQVALSLVLLSAGGLVVRSFERLLAADPGFRPEGLLTMRLRIPPDLFPETAPDVDESGAGDEQEDTAALLALQDRVEDALEALPGVTGVSAATSLPLTASAGQSPTRIPGAPGNTGDAERDAPLVDRIGARAGYVEVMGMRVLAGRTFDNVRRDGVREALIDGHLARHFFPTGSPLGAKIPFGEEDDEALTIVGVVEQARLYDVDQDGRPQFFFRAEDLGVRGLSFVVRTGREPHRLIPEVRTAVQRLDPRLVLGDVRTMDEIVGDALRQQRMSAVLIAGFALGALLLAAMGLFGVVSGSVTRRRHELAVRLALGADHARVLRLVLREGALLVGIGLLIGVPGIYAAGALIRGVLVGVSPGDPLTLLAVALGLTLVAMAACYVPARRVLGIDPAQSLREE
ncbi:MAG: FtsX-like permease family protein [Luteitalea sp.]|nr:FtsX-like permease family protein [Luteitalea sp.]